MVEQSQTGPSNLSSIKFACTLFLDHIACLPFPTIDCWCNFEFSFSGILSTKRCCPENFKQVEKFPEDNSRKQTSLWFVWRCFYCFRWPKLGHKSTFITKADAKDFFRLHDFNPNIVSVIDTSLKVSLLFLFLLGKRVSGNLPKDFGFQFVVAGLHSTFFIPW